ncbi:MAG: NAD-dependent epimerase/dehydratase family protein [Azoarcus sp.]|jgi:nucleoside-diphosphate-sugar epimerase|nr:NAD-dependent epimerase/dehydratase family protein [Azoarcus sp.]
MNRRVVITGGNGFIGSHITDFFLGRGVDIHHPDSRTLDILAPIALRAAFCGVDTVIHNAALVADWGQRERFFQINVEGTKNVLAACLETRVRHVIMTGSCSVFGEEHHPAPKDEAHPKKSHYSYFLDRVFPSAMNHYRDSKRDAVLEAIAFAKAHTMNLTLLHPVWVYGEREFHTGFYEYLKTVQGGVPAIMGCTDNLFHVIYAGDLAAAYYALFERAPQGVREYLIGNPEPVHMDTLYRLFCAHAGLQKPPNLPKALVYPVAFLLELAAMLLRRGHPPLLTRSRVNMFYDSIAYCTEKARRELGFTPHVTLEEGIAKTVHWYQEKGLL